MSIAKNSCGPLAGSVCSCLFKFGNVLFRAHVLQLPIHRLSCVARETLFARVVQSSLAGVARRNRVM